jgi:hypothetical protein
LRTSTIGLAHGDLDFRIIPCLSICSITNFSSLAKANGTRLGGCFSGFDEPVFIVCSNKCVVPRSSSSLENTCSNLFNKDAILRLSSSGLPSLALT